MLAGFLQAVVALEPAATLTSCVPFPLEPLRQRFPAVTWRPYDAATRRRCISECDVWLGLGGSPFQHALSHWFIDHLLGDAANCARSGKPMFYLGVGTQSPAELQSADVARLVMQAAAIWTRDAVSAERIAGCGQKQVHAAADLAHIFFRRQPPPAAQTGRFAIVANFDYGHWPGQSAVLRAAERVGATERVWLAQESRPLPGGERMLHAALPEDERSKWSLIDPELPGAPLTHVLARWPGAEWLLTARYHAALAGAWARSKVIVIGTNEKLRAAARELGAPMLTPDADLATVAKAIARAVPAAPGLEQAQQAVAACRAFLAAAGAPLLQAKTEPS